MNNDADLQAQVHSQVLEQGAFTPLELLLSSGRLAYEDYERWRTGDVEFLDDALMGNPEKIVEQLQSAAAYATRIGLAEDPRDPHARRASANPNLSRLIGATFKPAQAAPQMDLFFDNPIVATVTGLIDALSKRSAQDAHHHLNRLYAQAPNHPDLADYDQLLLALAHLTPGIETPHRKPTEDPSRKPTEDPHHELGFLKTIAPIAKRLLALRARDLMTPLWRHLAEALEDVPFSSAKPEYHRSFAMAQAQDWTAVAQSVREESNWQVQAPLCQRLAQSGFHRQHRADRLEGWFNLCWHAASIAAETLEQSLQPDRATSQLWKRFIDEDEEGRCTPEDFPAWMLMKEPGLAQLLPEALATQDTRGENTYRCIHRWIKARRARHPETELEHRKALRALNPNLFEHLKRSI